MTPDDVPWYAMRYLPAGRCRVVVRWEGREFLAARRVRQRTGKLAWCVPPRHPGGDVEWLPRRADIGRWSPDPEAWRPEIAAAWTWPGGVAPPALPVLIQPRLYSGDGRRRWSSMAEQADRSARTQAEIAAEIAAEHGDTSAAPSARRIGTRWWRDAALVTYSPPGQVSREEAEGRVCRAVLTDGVRPGERPQGWHGVGTALSQFVHEVITSEDHVREFDPLQRDLTDYESFLPMGWFAALNPLPLRRRRGDPWDLNAAQIIIVLHALGTSWRTAGRNRKLGVSGQRAMELYRGGPNNLGAIDKVWRAANGKPVLPWLPAVAEDPLDALRRRNRRARVQDQGDEA